MFSKLLLSVSLFIYMAPDEAILCQNVNLINTNPFVQMLNSGLYIHIIKNVFILLYLHSLILLVILCFFAFMYLNSGVY